MLPPGRRRSGAPSSRPLLLSLLFLLFASSANAAASVLGIDFGTLNLKAALVKPGIPLEIVLTKDSKRKEVAAVAFKPSRDAAPQPGSFPERMYGGDALALQGRFPGEVFPNLKPLLGLTLNEVGAQAVADYKGRYPAVQVAQVKELGTTLVKSGGFAEGEMPWSVEELLAMELANIRRNAETMAGKGNTVEDVVITIPAFYTVDERRAIERAATLAGLEVNALISDGLAVGIDYAKSRTFPEVTKGEKPEHHIVFDMGAGSTTATVLRFQSKSVKDVGRFNKTVQEVAVVGAGWDRQLGGDSLTDLVLNDYIQKFLAKPDVKSRRVSTDDIRSNGRAMARLWKDAEKARQVLSANTETSSSFEELLPDTDFKVKFTRTQFEELASTVADRVGKPIKDALELAKLEMSDIESIILHGGAVRTPFVQKQLEKIAGGSSKLRSNVNADESAVFGAAFKAAGLSPNFKVKEIRDSDIAGYAVGMTWVDREKEWKRTLFGPNNTVGSGATTKQVSFKQKADFSFSLYQTVDTAVGRSPQPVVGIETLNLTAGVAALKTSFGCEKEEVSTRFAIRLSPVDGVPEVVGGTVSCEVEGDGKGESLGDSVKDWLGFGKKKDQEALKEDEGEEAGPTESVDAATSSSLTGSATSAASSASSKVPEKPKKRTESIPISFAITLKGNPQPAPEELQRMRDRLSAFDKSDHARLAREEALNVLESYTYYVRDFLDNEGYRSVSTPAQLDAISKLLANTREFMENAKDATKEVLTEKYTALKKLVQPIQARRRESQQRPEKLSILRTSLDSTQKLVDMIKAQLEQAADAKKRAEEFDASQPASATNTAEDTASPTPKDSLDDLEEPDVAPKATEPPIPKYSSAADFTAYTDLDLSDLREIQASVLAWLDEKEAAQAALKPYDDPVLLVSEIEKKADELGVVMKDLLYKKMKAPPKSKTSKSKTSKTKKGKATSSGTTSAASETASPGVQEEFLEMVKEAKEEEAKTSSAHTPDEL